MFVSMVVAGCSIQHGYTSQGKSVIVTVDTTVINHNGTITLKK